ncbi:MAG: threonine/serine dehydratase [Acidimicrobiia bacterium]
MIELDDVLSARDAISPALHRTPLLRSSQLGEQLGVELWLKAELFQKTGSFKPRGMLNRVLNTSHKELQAGLITASAGNAAQGLAWAAREVGVHCVVVMPENAPATKAGAARGYGAEVVLNGPLSEVFDQMWKLQAERGLTFVHPFDDRHLIAGHGTIGLEVLEDLPDVGLVVVPVGGGGLISGVAAALKLAGSTARVVGVEPVGAAGLHAAWEANEVVKLTDISTIADGLAAPMAGELPLQITRAFVDDLVQVTDEEILTGLEAVMTRAKLYSESAGAAAVAALLAGKIDLRGMQRVVAVVSGGNLDFQALTVLAAREAPP